MIINIAKSAEKLRTLTIPDKIFFIWDCPEIFFGNHHIHIRSAYGFEIIMIFDADIIFVKKKLWDHNLRKKCKSRQNSVNALKCTKNMCENIDTHCVYLRSMCIKIWPLIPHFAICVTLCIFFFFIVCVVCRQIYTVNKKQAPVATNMMSAFNSIHSENILLCFLFTERRL